MKPVPGYEGLYSVTNDGQVYSHRTRRFIGGYRNADGYICAVLCRKYKRWCIGVHHLVALAWLGDPGDGFEVNHKDGVRDHNVVENLEWVTHHANCQADRALNMAACRKVGEENGAAKYSDEQISEVKRLRAAGLTQQRIEAETGISQQYVSCILRGLARAAW